MGLNIFCLFTGFGLGSLIFGVALRAGFTAAFMYFLFLFAGRSAAGASRGRHQNKQKAPWTTKPRLSEGYASQAKRIHDHGYRTEGHRGTGDHWTEQNSEERI